MARRAWDTYASTVDKVARPVIEPAAYAVARKWTEDMLGFWLMWHLLGGFEGLEAFGMHRATIWRKVKKFRTMYGEHPDSFRFEGVTIDPSKAWSAAARAEFKTARGKRK
jgi:hypothetical protein